MNETGILVAEGVGKRFGSVEALKSVSLSVGKGEFVALVGRSGSGKSTLLSVLAGLERPSTGTVVLAGESLTDLGEDGLALLRRRAVGFVFQAFHLIPTLPAWENVALPLFPTSTPSGPLRRRAVEWLARVGLADRVDHLPAALSGGERQRVALARALINGPAILFADEPTGNLDATTGQAILDLLLALRAELALTLVLVTHYTSLAQAADRVLHVLDGEVVQ